MKKPPAPVGPALMRVSDATAMQALANGKADADQQRHALDWILKKACGLPEWAFHESQRETDVALGRQFVGQQIVGLIKANVSQLRKNEERKHVVP